MRSVRRPVTTQAALMVEAFGVERAKKYAEDARVRFSKSKEQAFYWGDVSRAIQPPPPRVPPTPLQKLQMRLESLGVKNFTVIHDDDDPRITVRP